MYLEHRVSYILERIKVKQKSFQNSEGKQIIFSFHLEDEAPLQLWFDFDLILILKNNEASQSDSHSEHVGREVGSSQSHHGFTKSISCRANYISTLDRCRQIREITTVTGYLNASNIFFESFSRRCIDFYMCLSEQSPQLSARF